MSQSRGRLWLVVNDVLAGAREVERSAIALGHLNRVNFGT